MQKGGFSLPGPILPTRSMWQFWASETLQKRLSNASVTLQKRSTSGLHVLLDVFIHCGRFHGQWARRCGALLARVRVRLAAACATATPGFTPLSSVHPALKQTNTQFIPLTHGFTVGSYYTYYSSKRQIGRKPTSDRPGTKIVITSSKI